MVETGFPDAYGQRWLKVDEAFKPAILKKSVHDCSKRYHSDEIRSIPQTRPASALRET